VIDFDSAQEQLGPLHEPLVEGFKAGVGRWAELIEVAPHLAARMDPGARAHFIHPQICAEVEICLTDFPEVELTNALDTPAFKIGRDILLRIKYVGHGIPHNYPTLRQQYLGRQMYEQEVALRITGDPALKPPTLLTAGYTLEGKDLDRVEIRRDCEGHLPWAYDIFGGDTAFEPIVLAGLEDVARPAVVVSKRKAKLSLVEDVDEASSE
jgi:hypothetical protein